ncbi:IclR family transcriptional regulator [Yoonia sediminilitoris]|uniref:IclR family transcriptional regulator n=1 Tax=Yoonia sediminilitoris TaxID=1286148 RepID=A0A2T6KPL6_9RHOB|nr:IclR family transcriptional regulator [Yoonia sediminilitoris]PUB18513.1 IclR family transcriptional regulator [Yoonia sediminilitoris]RCW98681.1 IclR family transcriptional regulator [Yoonia sediminilitoris]
MTKSDGDIGETAGQIPTNLRLLLLLEHVARAGVPVTPSAVNEQMGLPKPTIHRLFSTAEAEGFLQRDIDGRSYSPGRRMRRLAIETLSAERVRAVRLVVLRAVAKKVGETCNIAIPEREGMYYLDRVETHWPLRIQLPIGTEVPFHCTASGKMYLSSLRPSYLDRYLGNYALEKMTDKTLTQPDQLREEINKTRAQGYGTDDEEFMAGMTAIAVPILDGQGRLVSTLSIHAPRQRQSIEQLISYLHTLREAAAELAAISGE